MLPILAYIHMLLIIPHRNGISLSANLDLTFAFFWTPLAHALRSHQNGAVSKHGWGKTIERGWVREGADLILVSWTSQPNKCLNKKINLLFDSSKAYRFYFE